MFLPDYEQVEKFTHIAHEPFRKPFAPLEDGIVKKVFQQGHSYFGTRSVLSIREPGKRARTPMVAFFNILITDVGELVTNHSEQWLVVDNAHLHL